MASKQNKQAARRQHTDEFRAGAVRLVLEEDRSVSDVARDLGISSSILYKWVRQAKVDRGTGLLEALTSSEREELAQLRKKVRVLEMERALLKKAAAFFAKENA